MADDENWVHAVIAADVDGRYFGLVCKRADCSRGGVSPPPKKPQERTPSAVDGGGVRRHRHRSTPRVPATSSSTVRSRFRFRDLMGMGR